MSQFLLPKFYSRVYGKNKPYNPPKDEEEIYVVIFRYVFMYPKSVIP